MATKAKEVLEIIEPKHIWVGDENAPVKLVMFGEYESDGCLKANEAIKQLMEQYKGKLKFNFRHFPLTQIHQRAQKAAEASVAASQEGKFWEMHNLLFHHRRNLGMISLKEHAREAGVVDKNFLPKLMDSVFGWTVRNDLLEGVEKGVRDVPTIYINDVLFKGTPNAAQLGKAIEEAFKISNKKPAKKRA
jgi:protein-disulfide isomerase